MKISDKIKTLNISEINPYGNNAKEHTADQIEKIKRSISKNSYIQPIVIDENKEIIIGHGRYEALRQLNGNDQDIEVVYVDYLDENEIKALRILDNKLNESAWIEEILSDEIANLSNTLTDEEIEEITGIDLSSIDEDYSEKNKEIDMDSMGDSLEHECPKCKYRFT